MIQGVHHFAIIVSSEKSISFYERFGFSVFKRIERHYDTVVLLCGHGIQIEMFVDATHPPKSSPEPLGIRHLALKVDSIEKTVKELGLEAGEIMKDWVGVNFCFIVDLDGNKLELYE